MKHPLNGNIYGATSTLHDMYQSTYLTDAIINGGLGRVLFSTNKGQVWQTLHDFGHPVIGLALDPNNLNRMYATVIHSTLGGILFRAIFKVGFIYMDPAFKPSAN